MAEKWELERVEQEWEWEWAEEECPVECRVCRVDVEGEWVEEEYDLGRGNGG